MSARVPVVTVAGQLQQLQPADALVAQGTRQPGSISLQDGQFVIFAKNLTLTGSQRLILAGASSVAVLW